MRLTVFEKPCLVHEAVLLAEFAFVHTFGERELIIKDPSKFGMTRNEVDEKYKFYIDYRQELLDKISAGLGEYEDLRQFFATKYGDNGYSFLTEGVLTWVEDIRFFTYDTLKKISLRMLYKEIEGLESSLADDDIVKLDYRDIYGLVDSLKVGEDEKMMYMRYYYNLDNIYEKLLKLLNWIMELYEENYFKVEKYVDTLVRERMESGNIIDSLSDINIPIKSIIGSCNGVSEMTTEHLKYYISTVRYNTYSITMPVEKYSSGKINEGLLITELLSL